MTRRQQTIGELIEALKNGYVVPQEERDRLELKNLFNQMEAAANWQRAREQVLDELTYQKLEHTDRKRNWRVHVDLPQMSLTLDDVGYNCNSEQALRWVKVLTDNPGEWIPDKQLERHDDNLASARARDLRKRLPPPVAALIETAKGKGSRIVLAE